MKLLVVILYVLLLSSCHNVVINDGLEYMYDHDIYLMITIPLPSGSGLNMIKLLLITLVLLAGTFTDEELEGLYDGEYMIAYVQVGKDNLV